MHHPFVRHLALAAALAALLLSGGCANNPDESGVTEMPATAEAPTATPPPPPPLPPPPAMLPPPAGSAGTGAPSAEARIPSFPCRPPNPSAVFPVQPAQRPATFGVLADRIDAALRDEGYNASRYYRTCGGFVVVTKVERLRSDGRPFDDADRFVPLDAQLSAIEDMSIEGILRALVRVSPGRFRMLAIVTSNRELAPEGAMTGAMARDFADGGVLRLPAVMRGQPLTPAHDITVLVYEFEKFPGQAEVRQRPQGSQPAVLGRLR